MKKINCLIIDDESIAQDILKTYIEDLPGLHLAGICNNALEALEIMNSTKTDLLFLDIEMPKLNGLDFLKSLSRPPAVILTTAYRKFALEGYELNVVDYLLKPFSFERFITAVDKYSNLYSPPETISEKPEERFTYFKSDRKQVRVAYDQILYFEGCGNYVKLFFNDEMLLIYTSLTELQERIPGKNFVRIHKSYIINTEHLAAYGKDYVEIGKQQISIGDTYKETFLRFLRKG